MLAQFEADLLARLRSTACRMVAINLSAVDVIDTAAFRALRRTRLAAALMGARVILVGLQPGVVSALVDLVEDVDEVEAVGALDDVFRLVESTSRESPRAGDG